jgi:hypothetical protein
MDAGLSLLGLLFDPEDGNDMKRLLNFTGLHGVTSQKTQSLLVLNLPTENDEADDDRNLLHLPFTSIFSYTILYRVSPEES